MHKKVLGSKKLRCLDGKVMIFIKCYCKSFQISLKISEDIPAGMHLKENNQKIFVSLKKRKNLNHPISLTRNISYRYDSIGLIKPIKIEIPYNKSKLVKGILIVSPELYLPLGMRKYAELEQDLKKDNLPIQIHPRNPRPSVSRFIPYTTTQVNHPYRG